MAHAREYSTHQHIVSRLFWSTVYIIVILSGQYLRAEPASVIKLPSAGVPKTEKERIELYQFQVRECREVSYKFRYRLKECLEKLQRITEVNSKIFINNQTWVEVVKNDYMLSLDIMSARGDSRLLVPVIIKQANAYAEILLRDEAAYNDFLSDISDVFSEDMLKHIFLAEALLNQPGPNDSRVKVLALGIIEMRLLFLSRYPSKINELSYEVIRWRLYSKSLTIEERRSFLLKLIVTAVSKIHPNLNEEDEFLNWIWFLWEDLTNTSNSAYEAETAARIIDTCIRFGHLSGQGDMGKFIKKILNRVNEPGFNSVVFIDEFKSYLLSYPPSTLAGKNNSAGHQNQFIINLIKSISLVDKVRAQELRLLYVKLGLSWYQWTVENITARAHDVIEFEVLFQEILKLPGAEARTALSELVQWTDEYIPLTEDNNWRRESLRIYDRAKEILQTVLTEDYTHSADCNLRFLWRNIKNH